LSEIAIAASSHEFDAHEATQRLERSSSNATGDDGNLLINDTTPPMNLEVAHILPYSLTQAGKDSELVFTHTHTHTNREVGQF